MSLIRTNIKHGVIEDVPHLYPQELFFEELFFDMKSKEE